MHGSPWNLPEAEGETWGPLAQVTHTAYPSGQHLPPPPLVHHSLISSNHGCLGFPILAGGLGEVSLVPSGKVQSLLRLVAWGQNMCPVPVAVPGVGVGDAGQ